MTDQQFEVLGFAREMLDKHGLTGWKVRWDHAKRRAGACHFKSQTLSFSSVLAQIYPAETMQDVVLHEVAHALAGPGHNHDKYWKSVARQVGAIPKALLPPDLPQPQANWSGTCPNCGVIRHLHSAPRRVASCGKCSRTFDSRYILQWSYRGEVAVPPGRYSQELRALQRKPRAALFKKAS